MNTFVGELLRPAYIGVRGEFLIAVAHHVKIVVPAECPQPLYNPAPQVS